MQGREIGNKSGGIVASNHFFCEYCVEKKRITSLNNGKAMRKAMILLWVSFLLAACSDGPVCYYLDAAGGDDAHSGLAPDRAWKSLEKLHDVSLRPGDKVLLKRGEVFHGELEITGQGMPGNRIYIDAYGDGERKPCIVGRDTSLYAARIRNSDYVTMQNLEIVNTGRQPLPCRAGLKIECMDYGVSRHIVVNNVTVRDVNGSLQKAEGGGCGMYIVNGGKEKISTFHGLTIENCHILRCARNAMIWAAYSDRRDWHPSKHTVIRGNLIEGVPGDGIVPIGCDSTLIEYNVMRDCPDVLPDTEAAAGIWPWSCDHTLVQFNEVSGHKAPWDAQGFDADWNCTGTVIQYNYSHDNYGGLVLVCNDGTADASFNAGNVGTLVRYNVSIGDGVRPKPTRVGMFSPAVHLAGPVKGTRITRNIIHQNPKPAADIDRTMMTLDAWGGYPDSTLVSGNVFYAPELGSFQLTESTRSFFEGNYYLGRFGRLPEDGRACRESDRYRQEVLARDESGYRGLALLMDTVEVAGAKGVFVNKEAIEDFFDRLGRLAEK